MNKFMNERMGAQILFLSNTLTPTSTTNMKLNSHFRVGVEVVVSSHTGLSSLYNKDTTIDTSQIIENFVLRPFF